MSVTVLPTSGPHTIAGQQTLLTFRLQIQGLHLDSENIDSEPIAKHGHVQIYLDRVPSDASTKMDMKNIFATATGAEFSIGLAPTWVKKHPGKHTLLVTLAQNNNVLYKGVKPAPFPITVQ